MFMNIKVLRIIQEYQVPPPAPAHPMGLYRNGLIWGLIWGLGAILTQSYKFWKGQMLHIIILLHDRKS